jgi:hypothetical protein
VNRAERSGKDEYARPIEKQGPLGVHTVPWLTTQRKAEGAWLKAPKVQEVTWVIGWAGEAKMHRRSRGSKFCKSNVNRCWHWDLD